MTNKPLEQVAIAWQDGESFLECFEDADPAILRTQLERAPALNIGEICSLVLCLEDRNTDFQLHATLINQSEDQYEFRFLAEERMRLEMVLVSARGESLPYRRRRHTRLPMHQQATLTAAGCDSQTGTTVNFGAGGLQVILEQPIALEETVTVILTLPGVPLLDLVGRVSGRIDEGPERGNSIEFLFRSPAERDDIAALVEQILAAAKDAS